MLLSVKFCNGYPQRNKDLGAYMLVAVILREVPDELAREIEEMIRINVENSPVLRAACDQVAERAQIELIEQTIVGSNIEIDATLQENLRRLQADNFPAFAASFANATDKEQFLRDAFPRGFVI